MKQVSQFLPEGKEIEFLDFYSIWPNRRSGPKKSRDLWKKISEANRALIIADVINRKANHKGWQDKQYIPAPEVYLRAEGWLAEIIPIPKIDNSILGGFYKTLKGIYGNGYIERQFGDNVPNAWRSGLPNLTVIESARILRALTDDSDTYLTLQKIKALRRIRKGFSTEMVIVGPVNPTQPLTLETELEKMRKML